VLFGARLAKTSAGEAAADRERKSAPFACEERRHRDGAAHDGACIRAGDEPGEKRTFQHQVGGVVVQKQARHDTHRQRNGQAERECQPVGPIAALEDQDVAEAVVTGQHRGERRHDRQFADERGEQELLCGEQSGVVGHEGLTALNCEPVYNLLHDSSAN
jgi:hypothetical protein